MKALALAVALAAASGCATTEYQPQLVARGELTLRYQGGFEMWSGGRRVARGLGWSGLPEYVRCVPPAADQAQKASHDGTLSMVLSISGGILGVLPLGALIGFGVDYPDHVGIWLGTGVGMAVAGVVLAGLGRKLKNSANGHAVDALNYYNDAVGSLGATCDDLRYPPPAAFQPPPQLPPPQYPPPQYPPPQYPPPTGTPDPQQPMQPYPAPTDPPSPQPQQ